MFGQTLCEQHGRNSHLPHVFQPATRFETVDPQTRTETRRKRKWLPKPTQATGLLLLSNHPTPKAGLQNTNKMLCSACPACERQECSQIPALFLVGRHTACPTRPTSDSELKCQAKSTSLAAQHKGGAEPCPTYVRH